MHLHTRPLRLLTPLSLSLALSFPAYAQAEDAPEAGPPEATVSAKAPSAREPDRLLAPVVAPQTSDPWTSRRVALLAERQTYQMAVLPGDVLSDILGALPQVVAGPLGNLLGGQPFPDALGNATAEVTTYGGRLELGNWGFSFGVGSGTLASGGLGGGGGGPERLPLSTMTGSISLSLGAWAPLDIGGIRLRIGVSWPEFHLRFTRGVLQAPAAEMTWLGLQLGVSALGLRVTLGELLFLEARMGEANVQVAYLVRGDARALQRGYGYDLLPTFRAGLSF